MINEVSECVYWSTGYKATENNCELIKSDFAESHPIEHLTACRRVPGPFAQHADDPGVLLLEVLHHKISRLRALLSFLLPFRFFRRWSAQAPHGQSHDGLKE